MAHSGSWRGERVARAEVFKITVKMVRPRRAGRCFLVRRKRQEVEKSR